MAEFIPKNTIFCNKGCCHLEIYSKPKPDERQPYPFEKRKAGVLVCSSPNVSGETKILMVQSYNNCWGIPKGQMEPFDDSPKECAQRELYEETGLNVTLQDSDLYRILLDNCYVYKISVSNMDVIDLSNLPILDSTGIGWVKIECAFDLNITFLTRKILMGLEP